MKKITAITILKNDIRHLEDKQAHEWVLLKKQFLNTYESLKPFNLLKSTLEEAFASQGLKNNFIGNVMGFTAGVMSKILVPGSAYNKAKGIFGTLLQLCVSNVAVSKSIQSIKLSDTSKKSSVNESEIKTQTH